MNIFSNFFRLHIFLFIDSVFFLNIVYYKDEIGKILSKRKSFKENHNKNI